MKPFFKRVCIFLLCFALWTVPALSEDLFSIDVDALDLSRLNSDDYVAAALSSSAPGIRILKELTVSSEVACSVRLTLQRMDTQALLFDKNYGYQSNDFDSGVIYLPYASNGTVPCLITLYAGDYVYALPFMHLQRHTEAENPSADDIQPSDGWSDGWDDGWSSGW